MIISSTTALIQAVEEFGDFQKVYLNGRGVHKRDEERFNETLKMITEQSGDIKSFCIMRIDGAVKLFVATI